MNEPRRWLDEGAPEAIGRMLSAASGERPSAAALNRAVASVAAGGMIVTSASGASAGAGVGLKTAASAPGVFLKWTLLGSLATLGATGLWVEFSPKRDSQAVVLGSPSARTPRAMVSAPARQLVGDPGQRAAAAQPAFAVHSIVSAAPPPSRVEPRLPGNVAGHPSAGSEEANAAAVVDVEILAQETSLVDRARAELAAGSAATALQTLDEYQTRFPLPRYAPEALYLRMFAQLSLGNNQAARAVAGRLAKAYPTSPQAERAEVVLSTTNP